MRKGFDGSIWRSEDGKLIAINLGADHVAEHEWGIKQIRTRAKMNDSALGLEKRMVTVDPFSPDENLIHSNLEMKPAMVRDVYEPGNKKKRVTTKWYGLLFDRLYSRILDEEWWKEKVGYIRSVDDEVSGHWDEQAFCVLTQNRTDIEDLLEAFKRKDVAIWVGGSSNPFRNGGLIVAIASRMLEVDTDRVALNKAAGATGIADRLAAANKRYYALSPRWANEEKTEVVFWLNPMDQHIVNYGWFTVSQLEDWIKGVGPIPKTPATA